MTLSNDSPERFSWMILLSRNRVLMVWETIFQISSLYLLAKKNYAVPRFILLSKQCHWEQSFTKTISNYFCVISPYEFRICWKSCWKVDKFFTIEQERKSTDAWIFFNFFQPNTNDNSPSLRNCWVFFYLLFFVSLFLLHQSLTDLFL